MLKVIENTSNRLLIRANSNAAIVRKGFFVLVITQESRVVKTVCVQDVSGYPEFYNLLELTEGEDEDLINGVVSLDRGTHRVKIYHSNIKTTEISNAEYLYEDYLYIR